MNWINTKEGILLRFAEAMVKLAHIVEDRAGKKKIVVVDLFCGGGGFSSFVFHWSYRRHSDIVTA